jgi:hypothetical protein
VKIGRSRARISAFSAALVIPSSARSGWHRYRRGVREPAAIELKRTQPAWRRSARAGWLKITSDASVSSRTFTAPKNVERRNVESGPALSPPGVAATAGRGLSSFSSRIVV